VISYTGVFIRWMKEERTGMWNWWQEWREEENE
jgi:hypothetical protein